MKKQSRSKRTALSLVAASVAGALVLPAAAGADPAVTDGTDVIYVIAGTGEAGAGTTTDGVVATTSALNSPQDVAVGPDGAIYVVDRSNNKVWKIVDGKVSTFAGAGTAGFTGDGAAATAAELDDPRGVDVTPDGKVYIADTANNRIRVVGTDGVISTVAGSGASGVGTGTFTGDTGAATAATLNFPHDVAVTDAGVMYITDNVNNRIRMVDAGGIITTIIGDGDAAYFAGAGVAADAKVSAPSAITLDGSDNVIFADNGNDRIRKIAGAAISTIAGVGVTEGYSGDGGPAVDAELKDPEGVAVGSDGSVYFSDTNNHVIRKIATDGKISTIAGSGGTSGSTGEGSEASTALLFSPEGMAIDSEGDLIFVDVGNNVVREIKENLRILRGVYANSTGDTAAVARMYIAVMGRQPEAGGHAFWMSKIAEGWTLSQIIPTFIGGTEFQGRYGNTTDEEFVDLHYQNILGRVAESAGRTFWLNSLADGSQTRVSTTLFFSQGLEIRQVTHTS